MQLGCNLFYESRFCCKRILGKISSLNLHVKKRGGNLRGKSDQILISQRLVNCYRCAPKDHSEGFRYSDHTFN